MKQYLRSIHRIQLEIGGDGSGSVFECSETSEVVAEVVEILDITAMAPKAMRTRYNCEEEDKDDEEGMIYIPARLLFPVCHLILNNVCSLMKKMESTSKCSRSKTENRERATLLLRRW
jgi:hypothetical protein